MRKLVISLLTFIILFNTGGHFVFFSLMQKRINEEIEQQIRKGVKESDLTVIVVPAAGTKELAWIKPGKEFRYRGELYDIVHSTAIGQKKSYSCINDRKEKQLIAAYHKSQNSRKESDKKIKSNLNDRYFPAHIELISIPSISDIGYTSHACIFISNTLLIPSPPPKQA